MKNSHRFKPPSLHDRADFESAFRLSTPERLVQMIELRVREIEEREASLRASLANPEASVTSLEACARSLRLVVSESAAGRRVLADLQMAMRANATVSEAPDVVSFFVDRVMFLAVYFTLNGFDHDRDAFLFARDLAIASAREHFEARQSEEVK